MSLVPIFKAGDPGLNKWLDRRPAFDAKQVAEVANIIANVQDNGEEAVLKYTRQFDAPDLNNLFVQPKEFQVEVTNEEADAIDFAIARVQEFHHLQHEVITHDWEDLGDGTFGWRTDVTDEEDTGFEGQRLIPLSRVGVYVPGGMASYPSSVIMNVVPAQEAGVEDIVVATPPRKDGTLSPAVLYACNKLGIQNILKSGGAAAVAAMALGTENLARVDKIVGPGNSWVNEAKRQLWGSVGLDGYAGPSEVAVYIDNEEYAAYAAADLLTQVEHAPDNVGMLIATSEELLQSVLSHAETQIQETERKETLQQALKNFGVAVIANDQEATEIINRFAPEHLSIISEDAPSLAGHIKNCGCVLIGPYTPQSCGDFVSGPSHTLPTSGAARFGSPVNVQDFLKYQSISMLTQADVSHLAATVEAFGKMEGFPVHAFGTTVRL